MQIKKLPQTFIIRLDPGEEIMTALTDIAKSENIRLAAVSGIGAVNDITIGLFDPVNKQYLKNDFKDNFEMVSLTGNISTMNGETYPHLHMAVADVKGKVYGGHLNKAVVSATAEIFISVIDGAVDRAFSEKIGLNILKL